MCLRLSVIRHLDVKPNRGGKVQVPLRCPTAFALVLGEHRGHFQATFSPDRGTELSPRGYTEGDGHK